MRVAEKDVKSIASILEDRDADWPSLGRNAGAAYREFFRNDVAFHRIAREAL